MKKLLIFVLIMTLSGGVALAEEPSFWGGLLKKVNKLVARSPRGTTHTSVVGIRGTQEDTSSDSLYWKNQKNSEAESYSAEEIEAFTAAVRLAEQGDYQKALEDFGTFLKTYPESKLCSDVVSAMDRLKHVLAENQTTTRQVPQDESVSP